MKFEFNLTTLILAAVIIGLLLLNFDQCNKSSSKEKENQRLLEAMADTLHLFKNKDSQNVARIMTLETSSARDFIKLKTRDSVINKLQDIVKDNKSKLKKSGGSAIVGNIETNISGTGVTTIVKVDTIKGKDSIAYIYPTYKDSVKNKWVDYEVTINKDSANRNIKINNEFSVVLGYEKGKPFAELTTENPYSSTRTFRAYQVSTPKPKRWSVNISCSYGTSSNFQFQPFIGIGVGYSLFSFRL